MPYLSLVSPVYNADKIIPELLDRIQKSLLQITKDFEIILVEDGSTDRSWEIIENLSIKYKSLTAIKLSRNFGQHYAITAGLDQSRGEWVVVMDCDLQDQPEEIKKLHNKALEGFDIVLARRAIRKDSFIKRNLASLFYKILAYLSGNELDEKVANFGIYNRKVINSIGQMRESIRYFPTMINWIGFNATKIDVQHSFRNSGKSSYNFDKLLRLALDIILSYSDKPIRILIKIGLFISVLSFWLAIIVFIKWLSGNIIVIGYTSLMISIWFLSGVILSTLGLVGLYVGKTFEGVKRRPIYLIEKTLKA